MTGIVFLPSDSGDVDSRVAILRLLKPMLC
jgi:hypothetical protein